ncbi:MAG: 1-(5-phosphoribosyl)-5-[(5-phosphoribosylamino)methylideneamino]imidazole-4-carboxamide isomerase [Bacteroidetes bacterium]|nr:1-(5-phosphoribosyl)-5-[(5-phosphoribosylamino)methylideneamino]imidazole-4-carboxamide isomerase [Bacteroidota bacterium]
MLILPAIDIFEGKCVRLRQGSYTDKTVYSVSPTEVAQQFRDAGLTHLHVVDLEGAREQKIVNWKTIESIAQCGGIYIEVGGGIRSSADIEKLLSLGVSRVVLGSIAVHSPSFVHDMISHYGTEQIVIAVDIKEGFIAIHGWQEKTTLTANEFIHSMISYGALHFICTDIARDGMLKGPNLELYTSLTKNFSTASFIASGGIASKNDILTLAKTSVSGVIVGKAFYEGTISLQELSELHNAKIQC